MLDDTQPGFFFLGSIDYVRRRTFDKTRKTRVTEFDEDFYCSGVADFYRAYSNELLANESAKLDALFLCCVISNTGNCVLYDVNIVCPGSRRRDRLPKMCK